MPTYTEILNTQIDQDSALVQELVTAFRDNLVAVVTGDDTAPRAVPKALQTTAIYSGPNDLATNWSITNLDDFEVITFKQKLVYVRSVSAGAAFDVRIRLSDDNGAVYADLIDMVSGSADSEAPNGIFVGKFFLPDVIDLKTGYCAGTQFVFNKDAGVPTDAFPYEVNVPLPAGPVNAIRFSVVGTNVSFSGLAPPNGGHKQFLVEGIGRSTA